MLLQLCFLVTFFVQFDVIKDKLTEKNIIDGKSMLIMEIVSRQETLINIYGISSVALRVLELIQIVFLRSWSNDRNNFITEIEQPMLKSMMTNLSDWD